jgi:hypothetical protein
MGKNIHLGSAKPDDPIYSSGSMVNFKPLLTPATANSSKDTAGTTTLVQPSSASEQVDELEDGRYRMAKFKHQNAQFRRSSKNISSPSEGGKATFQSPDAQQSPTQDDDQMTMSNIRTEVIKRMKSDLLGRVAERFGMDMPKEGSEDYESWHSKLAEIDGIENIQEVVVYLESEGFDLEDFFLCGEYEVISAGLNPDDVPNNLFTELGELVAEQTWEGGSWVNIYLYDRKYFVLNEVETSIADTEAEALKLGGIGNDSYDEINYLRMPAQREQLFRTNVNVKPD